jgi:hypothetical protein
MAGYSHNPNPYDPTMAAPPATPFSQPTNIFRFGENVLWSTQLLGGAVAIANSNFRLFAQPRGAVAQGFANALTIAETNLKEGGRIPAGVAYSVYGIACQTFQSTAAADGGTISAAVDTAAEVANLTNIQYNGVLAWDFIQTFIDIAPIMLIGAGGGTGGALGTGNAVDVGNVSNGFGQIWMYRKYPTELPATATFAVNLSFGSRAAAVGANSVAVRVCLLGYYKNIIEIG